MCCPTSSVEVVDRLDLVKSRYSAAEVSAFRRAYNELRRGGDRAVGFDSEVSRLLEAGETDRAVRRADELVRASPSNPVHRARLSRALLQSGFTDRARDVARQHHPRHSGQPGRMGGPRNRAARRARRGSPLEPPADVEGAVQAFRKLRRRSPTRSANSVHARLCLRGRSRRRTVRPRRTPGRRPPRS